MEDRMTAKGKERLGGGGIDRKRKRTHGHGQQHGDCRGEEHIRGLNGNGKKYNKNKIILTTLCICFPLMYFRMNLSNKNGNKHVYNIGIPIYTYASFPLSSSSWFLLRYFIFLCTNLTADFPIIFCCWLFSLYMKTIYICVCAYVLMLYLDTLSKSWLFISVFQVIFLCFLEIQLYHLKIILVTLSLIKFSYFFSPSNGYKCCQIQTNQMAQLIVPDCNVTSLGNSCEHSPCPLVSWVQCRHYSNSLYTSICLKNN